MTGVQTCALPISTDDAQIDARIHEVSARVAGTVVAVKVEDNQFVEAGTVLAELDTRPYQVAVEQAKAAILMGQWLLVVGVADEQIVGMATFSFINRHNDRVAFITALAGANIITPGCFESMCAIARAHGATKIQGYTRESVARLARRVGFKPVATVIEVSL